MKRVFETSYPVRIYIAGDVNEARRFCRQYAREHGACVTVTPTVYVYTRGEEAGVIIGLINYPRFPKPHADILAEALALAELLIEKMCQWSATVEAPDQTVWLTCRPEDN